MKGLRDWTPRSFADTPGGGGGRGGCSGEIKRVPHQARRRIRIRKIHGSQSSPRRQALAKLGRAGTCFSGSQCRWSLTVVIWILRLGEQGQEPRGSLPEAFRGPARSSAFLLKRLTKKKTNSENCRMNIPRRTTGAECPWVANFFLFACF